MLQPAFPLLELLADLPEGGLLLTPNNRLRNRCQQVFARHQQRPNWAPPPVASLRDWIEGLWNQLQQQGWAPALVPVLNPEQRQLLWQKALDATLERQLLNSVQLCRDADTALSQLIQWRLLSTPDLDTRTLEPLLDEFALQRASAPLLDMIDAFGEQLQICQAITPDQRDLLIVQAFSEDRLPGHTEICLAGFSQIAPLAQHLVNIGADTVRHADAPVCQQSVAVAGCASLEEELTQAAHWAASILEGNPHASIGIVVNNLGQCRDLVEGTFAKVLEPQVLDHQQHRYTLPFNFSAGTPLARTPVGASALQLLELLQEDWDYGQLRNILFNPFWGNGTDDPQDLSLRSALLRQLQQRELHRISGDVLRYECERQAAKLDIETPVLSARLQRIGDATRRWNKAPADKWAERFSAVLEMLGWPGQRIPDSQEYQQLLHWEGAIESLANLGPYAGNLTTNQALQHLRRIASRTPFQAETRDGPVQILGVLEAGGLAFEHLWMVGFGQQQWPPAPSPNPLLPLQWQKHWKMPRASAERELELARELGNSIIGACNEIVVSYPQELDSVAQSLSALFPAGAQLGLSLPDPPTPASIELERISDAQMPALSAAERAQVRGGASVLKAQALCPLNAQLRYRLGARALETPGPGLSAAERGNLVHQALAEFWEYCGNSTQLAALDSESLQEKLEQASVRALRQIRPRHPELPEGFWSLEQQRLVRLLNQWLELEQHRPTFDVSRVEWEQPVEIEGLRFRLRLDRLDQLAEGEQLVIDYKTGVPAVSDWLQARVREPQLPLYALSQPDARAIAFGQVRYGDCKWRGCGELSEAISGIKPVADQDRSDQFATWNALTEHWQSSLATLAAEYRHGVATLTFDRAADDDPALWPLNRSPERRALAEEV